MICLYKTVELSQVYDNDLNRQKQLHVLIQSIWFYFIFKCEGEKDMRKCMASCMMGDKMGNRTKPGNGSKPDKVSWQKKARISNTKSYRKVILEMN